MNSYFSSGGINEIGQLIYHFVPHSEDSDHSHRPGKKAQTLKYIDAKGIPSSAKLQQTRILIKNKLIDDMFTANYTFVKHSIIETKTGFMFSSKKKVLIVCITNVLHQFNTQKHMNVWGPNEVFQKMFQNFTVQFVQIIVDEYIFEHNAMEFAIRKLHTI